MKKQPFVPFFTTSRYRVETMVELSEVRPDERVADLGAGDGRIALAFAQKGAIVTAYELADDLYAQALTHFQTEHLSEKITLLQVDFWNADFSHFDIITIYPMPDIMEDLEKKLISEARPGTRILTNYYQFEKIKPVRIKNHIYLYQMS